MNALINMYILINKVSQVALYVYIGSKAIHLWNCLFASLPESHWEGEYDQSITSGCGAPHSNMKIYYCYTIVPNFPLYNMHSGVETNVRGVLIRALQVAVGHHIQTWKCTIKLLSYCT